MVTAITFQLTNLRLPAIIRISGRSSRRRIQQLEINIVDGVGVTHRIGDWHEPKLFDIVTGEQAERRGVGKPRDAVDKIRDENIIHVNADLLIGSAHDGELREELVVGGSGDSRQGLQRPERSSC